FVVLLVALAVLLPFSHQPGPFFSRTFGLRLSGALLPAFGIMAPALALCLAVVYARKAALALWPMLGGTVAGVALALPRPFGPDAIIYLRALGPSGLFLAMLVCGVVAGAIAIAQRTIAGRRLAQWAGATVGAGVFAAFLLAHVSVAGLVAAAMLPLAHLGDSYIALMAIVFIETLLWTAGIHGPATLAAVVTPLYLALQAQNTQAFIAHQPLPHIVVVSLFLFVFPGGAGGTLPLAVLLLRSRITRLRQIGHVAILPAFFNINEPLIFGAPIVFNPYLAIPFIIVPLVLATTTYGTVALDWVARPAMYVPSSVPSIISTYLATYDVRAVVLLAVNIVIAALLYWPFVRAYERHLESGV
ncbi:MAG: PTS transporter subunit EIIC, partial [Vulcanimicrobiaceae bacterium]